MRYLTPDFVVKHNYSTETDNSLIKKIFYSIFYRPTIFKFPVIVFIAGGSGHGKSYTAAKIIELICEHLGINYIDYFREVNVFHPVEYMQKFNNIIKNKELKKIRFICVHESRIVLPAKLWYSFINQNISDINAITRQVKPLLSIFISQKLSDLTKDVRSTLNYYITVHRPKGSNAKVRMRIRKIYHDERDIENIKMRTRRLRGYVIDQYNKYHKMQYSHIEIMRPSEPVQKLLKELDAQEKRKILEKKMKETHNAIMKEIGSYDKVDRLINYYYEKDDQLREHIKYGEKQKRYRIGKDFIRMHGLDRQEIKEFEVRITKKLVEKESK